MPKCEMRIGTCALLNLIEMSKIFGVVKESFLFKKGFHGKSAGGAILTVFLQDPNPLLKFLFHTSQYLQRMFQACCC